MIEFSLFGFPVRVHWSFWLLAFFLGGGFYARDPDDWTRVLVAIGVIFVSILVHELGHAFAGRHYRARPEIMLLGTGGLCSLPGTRFTRPQHIFVSFAGPLAGFALAALLYVAAGAVPHHQTLLRQAVAIGLFVNIVSNVLNLLPISRSMAVRSCGTSSAPPMVNLYGGRARRRERSLPSWRSPTVSSLRA